MDALSQLGSRAKFEVMLTHNYMDSERRPIQNPVHWYMSEKYDGERAQWDGAELKSRNGNTIPIPSWFRSQLEQFPHKLDGELFLGRGTFFQTGMFRAREVDENLWKKVKYMVFDIPDSSSCRTWLERQERLRASINKLPAEQPCQIRMVSQTEIRTKDQMNEFYQGIIKGGGEGIILVNPHSLYEDARSRNILKYKPLHDTEGVIMGYKEGRGKFIGMLGSFIVHPLEDGRPNKKHEFSISGMTNEVRKNYLSTHPVGTIITYAYRSLTNTGKPFHPSYKGKRGFYNIEPLPTLEGYMKASPIQNPNQVSSVPIPLSKPRITVFFKN